MKMGTSVPVFYSNTINYTHMITVSILAATICFSVNNIEECHPILIGKNTPIGTFPITHMTTKKPGYGGDILVFKETSTTLYAIHRLWKFNPKQKREQRLATSTPKDNIITSGCINVESKVYERLTACCSKEPLEIKK